MEVEIGEYLTREVSDRETDSCRGEKKTLVPRESLPIGSFSFDDAILGRVVSDDCPHKETECIGIRSMVLGINNIFDLREEGRSIDGHKKSGDIELQNPSFILIVIG